MDDDLHASLQFALGAAYTLERELGGGGMSRVFLAQDNGLERAVVVKALIPALASGVSAQRFAREVHAAATLQSPHIVPVLSAGHTQDDVPYYIMPFVHGETLRARLARGRVPYVEAVQFAGDVAKALAAAHEADIIHRDVKPDNILLCGESATVTDFGIARAIHESNESLAPEDIHLTRIGTSLGTPAYMAPEQATGDAVDARTDVYSWGVVAYEMICGHHPFPGATTSQKLIAAHIAERPPALSTRETRTPRWMCDLVMSCLSKDPAHRPADGAALVHAVEYGEIGHANPTARSYGRHATHLRRLDARRLSQTKATLLSRFAHGSGSTLLRDSHGPSRRLAVDRGGDKRARPSSGRPPASMLALRDDWATTTSDLPVGLDAHPELRRSLRVTRAARCCQVHSDRPREGALTLLDRP